MSELKHTLRLVLRNKYVIAGLAILSFVLYLCVLAFTKYAWVLGKWSDYYYWETYYPTFAKPAWISILTGKKYMPYMNKYIPGNGTNVCVFVVNYTYDGPPQDIEFIVNKTPNFAIVQLYVILPNGKKLLLDMASTSSTQVMLSASHGVYAPSLFGTRGLAAMAALFKEGGHGVYKFVIDTGAAKCLGVHVVVKSQVYGLLGTDMYGRDVWAGIVWGAPISLMVGVVAALIATAIGTLLGIISGYYSYRGRIFSKLAKLFVSETLNFAYDIVINFPFLILLILVSVTYGKPSPLETAVLIGLLGWGGMARIVHVITQQTAACTFIEAEWALGTPERRIMFRHIVPHVMPYVLIRTVLFIPSAILTEAALAFLGLSNPAYPSWGRMLEAAEQYSLYGNWWMWVPAGIMIGITCLAFMFIGRGLEEVINPRIRTFG